jgi:hypothetical protein
MLEDLGLNSERIPELAGNDPSAVGPTLKSMTDQVVRSEILFRYTMIDSELDHVILRHFFGFNLKKARSRARYRTLEAILQNLYPLQKLGVIRTFKKVPTRIVSNIHRINDLRNGVAHTFFLDSLPDSKRTYKGSNAFKSKGLRTFCDDAWEIHCFFSPFLQDLFPNEDTAP